MDLEWWKKGPYQVEELKDPTYFVDEEYMSREPLVLAPKGKSGALPTVIAVHGWSGRQEQLAATARLLASYGMLVISYTAMDQAQPFQWMDGLIAVHHLLEGENRRPESQLYQRVNMNAIALIGHSMGGAGVLHAAAMKAPNGLWGKLKTVVSMMPYHGTTNGITDWVAGGKDKLGCDISAATIPIFIVSGEVDNVNEPIGGYEFYQTLRQGKRVFFSFAGTNHLDWMEERGGNSKYYAKVMPAIVAWMLTYLCDDSTYASYFQEGGKYFELIKPDLKGNEKTGRGEFPAFEIKE